MLTKFSIALVVLSLWLPSALLADGLIYKLPEDGTWARFDYSPKSTSNDPVRPSSYRSLTIRSVGTAEFDGEACRWIETASEIQRNGQPISIIEKLLIPEQHLGKGKSPLAHVRKGWLKISSEFGGNPQPIKDLSAERLRRYNLFRIDLYGAFKTPKTLDKVIVESKLGKLECEGVTSQEKWSINPSIIYDFTYVIRLHETAPFGVVSHETTRATERDGIPGGAMIGTLKLVDFGKDAKSAIPESK